MKRMMILSMILGFAALCQAAKPVNDNLPGIPAQGADYWKKTPQDVPSQTNPEKSGKEMFFYTGKPYEAEIGAYIFQFRNYDPELQRWTSADPSGFPDGVNNYMYTCQPLSVLDSNGNYLTPIHLVYTFSGGGGTVEWKGNFVWSYDSAYEKAKDHKVEATTGLTGVTTGVTFESSDSTNTIHRTDPSGKNSMDNIVLHAQLVYTFTDEDGNTERTVISQADLSNYGNWYE